MVDWAVAEFEKIHGAGRANKLKSNARAIRRLRTACENAKRSVSSAPTTTLEVRASTCLLGLLCIAFCFLLLGWFYTSVIWNLRGFLELRG